MITKSTKAQRELPFSKQNCHSSHIIPTVSKLYYQSILKFDTPSHSRNITLTVGLRSEEMTDVSGSVWANRLSVASVEVTVVCVHWLKREPCKFSCCEVQWSSVVADINICQCRSVSGLMSASSKPSCPSSPCTLCEHVHVSIPSSLENIWSAAKSARFRCTNTLTPCNPQQASGKPGCCLFYPPHFKLHPLQPSGVKPPLAASVPSAPKAAFTHVCIPAIKP